MRVGGRDVHEHNVIECRVQEHVCLLGVRAKAEVMHEILYEEGVRGQERHDNFVQDDVEGQERIQGQE